MAFFDSYKNIDRGGITKDSKTATKDALVAACNNSKCRPHALQIVKALLDFKAHQSDDESAERLLGNLANHIQACNQAGGVGVVELTERSLHELVRNRSALFKKDLPDTFKKLLERLKYQNDAWGLLVDTNTARILRNNGLITEAEARAARPATRVAEQILPGDLAAFFNHSLEMQGAQKRDSANWPLSNFLKISCQDLNRGSSDREKAALADLIVAVSHGSLGGQKFYERQRQAAVVGGNRARFVSKMRDPEASPANNDEISPYRANATLEGGQGVNYEAFLIEAKKLGPALRRHLPYFANPITSMSAREESLRQNVRRSQHLAADYAVRSNQYQHRPTIMVGAAVPQSNAQHQEWLNLQEDLAAAARVNGKAVDAEAVTTTRALMICGARIQTVTMMLSFQRIGNNRGTYDLDAAEQRLLDRVTACLAPTHVGVGTAEGAAIHILCRGGDIEQRATTTRVETAARIVHQEIVREIRIPGAQPVDTFYLHQKRQIQFYWDFKANFIQARICHHTPWMCSTTDPRPIEVAW
jgi:hypothetical protein